MAATGLFAGLATLDIVHRVAAPLGDDEKVTALRQDVAAGGPATNAAVTFAALGGSATLLTALGSHPLARVAADDLAECGVSLIDLTPGEARSPAVSAIRVVEASGRRSVSSVNAGLREVRPPDDIASLLGDVLLVDGHHGAVALAAARAARHHAVPVLLDAGSWKPVLPDLLGLVDIAICSSQYGSPTNAYAPDRLLELGIGAVAVTNGARPIAWRTAKGRGSVTVAPIEARDTLSAGDVFHGAVAYQLVRLGVDAVIEGFADVLSFAAAVAGIRVSHVGPRAWLADPRLRHAIT